MVDIPKIGKACRVAELAASAKQIEEAYSDALSEGLSPSPQLEGLFAEFSSLLSDMIQAIHHKNEPHSLEEADHQRFEQVQALYHCVQQASLRSKPEIKEAGEKLASVLSRYGKSGIYAPISEGSALVDALLQDLAEEDLQGDIAKISDLKEIIGDLQASQNEFYRQNQLFIEQKAAEADFESASQLKAMLIDLLNGKMFISLMAASITDDAGIKQLAQNISQISSDLKLTLKRRKALAQNAKLAGVDALEAEA